MKRLTIVLCLLTVLLLTSVAVSASEGLAVGELNSTTQYFPEGTLIYGSISTSDATLDTIDGLLVRIRERMPNAGIPTVREAIDTALFQTLFIDFDGAIRPWLGDNAAFGVWLDSSVPGGMNALAVVELRSRQELMDFIAGLEQTAGESIFTVEDRGDYILYTPANGSPTVLALTENVAIFANRESDLMFNSSSSLATRPDFSSIMSQLPAPGYIGLMYMDTGAIIRENGADFVQFGVPGATGFGFTILDGDTVVYDLVQLPGDGDERFPALDTLDPAFLRYIPADASFTLHATNLNATYNGTVDTFRGIALQSGMTEQEFDAGIRQIDGTVRLLLNMDFQDDILSWMTGDYALFMTVDEEAIFALLPQALGTGTGQIDIDSLPFEIGLVMDATDPAAALQFSSAVVDVVERLVGQNPDTRIRQQQIGGANVTVVSFDTPLDRDNMLTVELAFGANDAVFVIGTLNAVTSVFTGVPGLDGAELYQDASRHLLENPTFAMYMDSYGFVIGTGVPSLVILALLDPAIGNIFEEVVDELESSALPASTIYGYDPSAARLQPIDPVEQFRQSLGLIGSASISAAVNNEGSMVIRIAITVR